MGELDGKVAVITGAGSGMAKAACKIFIREGAVGVIAADISGAEKDTAAELGDKVVPVHCDVTQEADIVAAIDAAVAQFGKIDAMLNVAGIAIGMPMLSVSQADYDRLLDINLRGVFLGTTNAIRAMKKTGGGSIVNWSSLAGLNASPYTSIYSMSKAGVIAATKAAALEHGPDNIRVNAICPGFVVSEGMGAPLANMREEYEPKVPLARLATPADVSELSAFLCSDRASYISGAIIPVDGGYGSHFA